MTTETPLEELRFLTAYLRGPRLLVKRDDKLPFGGSKFRKAVVLVEHATRRGATVIVTEGSVESQHARTLAIAARQRGVRCILALTTDASGDEPNLLDDSEGATILLAESEEERAALVESAAAALMRAGEVVEVVPFSGTNGLTTVAYMHAFEELLSQSESAGFEVDAIYLSSATGGIHAGLELGRRVTGSHIAIVGVTPGLNVGDLRGRIADLVHAGAELSGHDVRIAREEVHILDEYIGDGYLKPTEASRFARAIVRDLEGLELDAVYTAKTMAALIDQVRRGAIGARQTIVYWHSSA
jgi:1-aminocyclopropane-1-carboxylate deaminase